MISLQGGHWPLHNTRTSLAADRLNGLPFCFLVDYELDYKTVKLYREKGINLNLNIKLVFQHLFSFILMEGGGVWADIYSNLS